ncbi:MAG: hypothetical protein CSA50_02735 [Gammaproteobacteria bacterium]|nr:MAG: hypothetical protein CSA50_02735 [Gammaproteobacteria bacterium]
MNNQQPNRPETRKNPPFPANYLILTAALTVMATVFALETMGKIKHTDTRDAFEIAEYKGILVAPGHDHRLSSKPATIAAECVNGHVVFKRRNKNDIKALIVDDKNRPILCANFNQ